MGVDVRGIQPPRPQPARSTRSRRRPPARQGQVVGRLRGIRPRARIRRFARRPSGTARIRARHRLPRPSRLGATGGHRGGHTRQPGRRRRGGDGFGQDHAAAEDLPGTGPRSGRHDRAHPAAPPGRPRGRRAPVPRARRRAGRDRRIPGALHRGGLARHPRQAHDRRHPPGRDPIRPGPHALRHDHHRRGARTLPQHRLPARIPGSAAAAAARPQARHHLGDHRHPAVRRALRCARRRSLGAHVSGRDQVSAAGGRRRCRRGGRRRAPGSRFRCDSRSRRGLRPVRLTRRSDRRAGRRPGDGRRRSVPGAHGGRPRRHPRLPLRRG